MIIRTSNQNPLRRRRPLAQWPAQRQVPAQVVVVVVGVMGPCPFHGRGPTYPRRRRQTAAPKGRREAHWAANEPHVS